MVSSIPQLIPVENSPDKPQESINIGDTLEWKMILAWQSTSTWTKHKIRITHRVHNGLFIGDHSGLVFEMEVKWSNNEYFSLTTIHRDSNERLYYWTFHVTSIQKSQVSVLRGYSTEKSSHDTPHKFRFPDVDISDWLIDTTGNPEAFVRIDTTKFAVNKTVINGYDKDPSKVEESLSYLWDLQSWKKITGTIMRYNKIEEPMEYTIRRVGHTTIALTRIVYNPKTNEHKTKSYLLTDINMIRDNYAIGTISSYDWREKWEFLFSIEAFKPKSSALASSINWMTQKIRRA